MQTFNYVIQDSLGIHAMPAGVLVAFAQTLSSSLEIKAIDGRKANLKKIFSVMGLGVKCGDKVTINTDGPREKSEAAQLKKFFQDNL